MLLKRFVTAIFGIPAIFLIFYLGGTVLLLASVIIIRAGLAEFYRLARGMKLQPLTLWGYFIGLISLLFGIYFKQGEYLPYALGLTMAGSILYFLSVFPKWHLSDLMVTYFGVFYVAGLFSYLIKLREFGSHGLLWVLLVFLLTWTNDTAAYFVGTKFGKHRLAPNLSPKKSIEGLLGGLLFTIIAALIYGQLISSPLVMTWAILGVLASVVGTMGDLFASAFKRLSQVKDSGDLIPGHGGVLDRLDSLLFIAPLVYYYLGFLGF